MQRPRTYLFAAITLAVALAGCKNKAASNKAAGSGASQVGSNASAVAIQCPPGNGIANNVCVPAVTAEKIAAVTQQQNRVAEYANLLEKADVLTAPVELLGGFRQLEVWKNLVKLNKKLVIVDEVALGLDAGVKELRALKITLTDSANKLGDLRGFLDGLLTQPAVAQPLATLQAEVAMRLRGVLEPLEVQISKVAQSTLVPAAQKFADVTDMVIGACAMGKATGGGDALKQLCDQAKAAFGPAQVFLADFKTQPMALFTQLTGTLETTLSNLLDEKTQMLLTEAQTRINALMKVAATDAGAGSGSSIGSGAGSAGSAGSAN